MFTVYGEFSISMTVPSDRTEQFDKAITDTPCTVFYRELLEAYPEAKVVVTVRDSPEQWFDSQMRTM